MEMPVNLSNFNFFWQFLVTYFAFNELEFPGQSDRKYELSKQHAMGSTVQTIMTRSNDFNIFSF